MFDFRQRLSIQKALNVPTLFLPKVKFSAISHTQHTEAYLGR